MVWNLLYLPENSVEGKAPLLQNKLFWEGEDYGLSDKYENQLIGLECSAQADGNHFQQSGQFGDHTDS